MSDSHSHFQTRRIRQDVRRTSRRSMSLAVEGLETRALLSHFGPDLDPPGESYAPPLPIPMVLVMNDRAPIQGLDWNTPPPTLSSNLAHRLESHPNWSIALAESHGPWDQQPRLMLPGEANTSAFLAQEPILPLYLAGPQGMALERQLPDQAHVDFVDTLRPQDPAEYLRETPVSATPSLAYMVRFGVPNGVPDAQTQAILSIFTVKGDLVGATSMPKPGTEISLYIQGTTSADGTIPGLVFGITRVGLTSSSATPVSFSLAIDRVDRGVAGSSFAAYGRQNLDVDSSTSSRWVVAPRIDGASLSNLSAQGTDEEIESVIGMGQTIAGSLPLRAAGPSGGVLADGETTPQVGLLDGALIDLTMMDLSPDAELPAFWTDSAPLTLITSPSGLPLLASARPQLWDDFDKEITDKESVLVESDAEAIADEKPTQSLPPAPMAVGLGVAAGVAFGLILPDVIARFAPRGADKPRSRWARHNPWRKFSEPAPDGQ